MMVAMMKQKITIQRIMLLVYHPALKLQNAYPQKKHSLSYPFLPKCDHCRVYNGFKIGNPIAQLVDDVGTTKYESLQEPEVWFDAPTIISFQVACFHSMHPNQISMFTHMCMPNMVSKYNSEYDDEDIQCVTIVPL
jgi:hypothetical protein